MNVFSCGTRIIMTLFNSSALFFSVKLASCQEIQNYLGFSQPDGVYKLGHSDGGSTLVYCDMHTAGGGWSLVYRYSFTDYANFKQGTNAVSLAPDWSYSCDVPKSSTPPLSETEYGAVAYNRWQHLSVTNEFMIKSNITHWIKCTPTTQGASLATLSMGNFNCEKIKLVSPNCTTTSYANVILQVNYLGPVLWLNSASSPYYLVYWDCRTSDHWPAHDPCAHVPTPTHVKGVIDPYGAVYFR